MISLPADADLSLVPDAPAVFLLWAAEGEPYLARTTLLRRRLRRMLGDSRRFSLRGVVQRIEYALTPSTLASTLTLYELARRHFPDSYAKRVRLRMPAYVKLGGNNPFPRTYVTTRLSAGPKSRLFGPFGTRAAAEDFEKQTLDFFQLRRCQEDLSPSLDHPGCIYGEMNMCLRPCQEVVGEPEYATEAARVREFLETRGQSLVAAIERARDRASEHLDFEEAARQHKRFERVQALLRGCDELAGDVSRCLGVAVSKSAEPGCVELRFFDRGAWLAPRDFALAGAGVSMDARLRELVASLEPRKIGAAERQDHFAILWRWHSSTWRDGEWLGFDSFADLPYRKLVRAISRVSAEASGAGQGSLFPGLQV